jgi:tRNA G18 (ribose-2'-O)-methylase SpoU
MPALVTVAPFLSQPPRITGVNRSRYQLNAIFDNVRSAYNIGSMIRTASAVGAGHLYLCGITPIPEHPKVLKTSLGAEQSISWSQHNNSIDVVSRLQSEGHNIIAFEGGSHSQWLTDFAAKEPTKPVTVIVGNELSGVDPTLLEMCDQVLALPMLGEKTSLNVTVAFGIAAYYLRFLPLTAATPSKAADSLGLEESDAG